MRAIQTAYAGHRFRSRLEARWAVVFDQLGITWRYEPEGFILSDGSTYLPDFVLPSDGWTVEAKGDDSALGRDISRIARYVTDSGRRVLILGDVPDLSGGRAEHLAVIPAAGGPRMTAAYFMGWPVHPDEPESPGYAIIPGPITLEPPSGTIARINSDPSWRPYRPVVEAFASARAARFEFGETPFRARMGEPFFMAASEASGMEGLLESVEGIWTSRWFAVEAALPVDKNSRFQHPGRQYAPRPTDWKDVVTWLAEDCGLSAGVLAVTLSATWAEWEDGHVEWDALWQRYLDRCQDEAEAREVHTSGG
ncbi:hypothetical protein GCM10009836_20340 [Pseudonocardia ailaonensis]|uniref:Uncharacterized protein n=1 Tax=Pseudonocardia ailaonensis TaxID=367279 RepID=A0ABN2MWT6_9PSEU